MLEYLGKGLSVWFLGFFPLAEIYVAVPAGIALGLGWVSVVFWAVFGNFFPVLLIHYAYDQLRQVKRINAWLDWLASEKARDRVNRWGVWAVLVFTPWTGVWLMAVTAKALGMKVRPLLGATFTSIMLYALVIVLSIQAGMGFFA